jgi:hypothetical protein
VCKLRSSTLELLYATFLGGNGTDDWSRIEVDILGHAYVTGRSRSTDFPTTPDALPPSAGGDGPIFVSKLSIDGSTLLYSTLFGGSSDDIAHGIVVDDYGDIYLHGYTRSNDFPTTTDAFDTTFNYGVYDAFISKIEVDYMHAIPLINLWSLLMILILVPLSVTLIR